MRWGRNSVVNAWGALVFLLVGGKLEAQSYSNAVGIRVGESSGITLKTFTGSGAFDFIVSVWPNDLAVFALYERNHPLGDNGLGIYYGGGAHVAFNRSSAGYYRYEYPRTWYHTRNRFGVGLDAIVGLEYKIPRIPLALSIDIKPYLEVNRQQNVFASLDSGLGIKFCF